MRPTTSSTRRLLPLSLAAITLVGCTSDDSGDTEGSASATAATQTAGTATSTATQGTTATATDATATDSSDAGTVSASEGTTQGTTATTSTTETSTGTSTASTTTEGTTATTTEGTTATTGVDTDTDTDTDTTGEACSQCAPDLHSVQDCMGGTIEACSGTDGCDLDSKTCINACQAAENSKQSVGCEYYATFMQHWDGPGSRCFAAFVANTWNTPAKLAVERPAGQMLNMATFTWKPVGNGMNLTYSPYDPNAGLGPGEVAILFLAGPTQGQASCPKPSAVASGANVVGTGMGDAFRITSDVPVVAYQINPYGGGSAAVTGASLLLPTSAWDTNYVIINSLPKSIGQPTANIIADEDGTEVTIEPIAALAGGGGIPSSPQGVPAKFMLGAGRHAQITQDAELTGSVIQSTKKVGLMGGHTGMQAPVGVAYSDHAEQMIPPVRALGSEYVGVMYRPRVSEPAIWRVVGAVDGTQLTWTPDVGGPATLDLGDKVEFITSEPFVVKSQDSDHPFLLFTYMSGSTWQPGLNGYGDSDYVISVPTDQYMRRYVFFADPTYPETNLVIVRRRSNQDVFEPVNLDCAGDLGGWTAVGEYEWTRADLSTGNFMNVGNCATGRREISSNARFGLWIWGWGTPNTSIFTQNVSYGYPGGMNVQSINDVVIIPQ
ncbi:MAG: IgGFc-binding protein [Nannocystaceae bacterium]